MTKEGMTKVVTSVTLDQKHIDYCREHCINVSKLLRNAINNLIREYEYFEELKEKYKEE